jgi:hypothetical protein
LLVSSVLEEFLDDIVPKNVIHQIVGFWQYFRENKLFFFGGGNIVLLLDEPGSILVHRTLHHMVFDVFYFYFFPVLDLLSKLFKEFALWKLNLLHVVTYSSWILLLLIRSTTTTIVIAVVSATLSMIRLAATSSGSLSMASSASALSTILALWSSHHLRITTAHLLLVVGVHAISLLLLLVTTHGLLNAIHLLIH